MRRAGRSDAVHGGAPLQALTVALALAVALSACASEGWDPPEPGPHESYVSRVLAALVDAQEDVLDRLGAEGEVTSDIVDDLNAIYTDAEAERRESGLRNVVDRDAVDERIGDRSITVRSLPVARHDCVLAEVDIDFPGRGPDPPDEAVTVVELVYDGGTSEANPTGWRIEREELLHNGAEPVGC